MAEEVSMTSIPIQTILRLEVEVTREAVPKKIIAILDESSPYQESLNFETVSFLDDCPREILKQFVERQLALGLTLTVKGEIHRLLFWSCADKPTARELLEGDFHIILVREGRIQWQSESVGSKKADQRENPSDAWGCFFEDYRIRSIEELSKFLYERITV